MTQPACPALPRRGGRTAPTGWRARLNPTALPAVCPATRAVTRATYLEKSMLVFIKGLVVARPRAWWLLVAILPLVLAACTNGSGTGSGY